MQGSEWAAIFVALISVVSAGLAGRAARAAAKYNSDASVASTRAQAETEAYNRARKMDIETIERQDKEIEDLALANIKLNVRCKDLERRQQEDRELIREQQEQISSLKRRVARLSLEGRDNG